MIMSWMDSYVIFRTGSVMRIYCFMGRQIMLASWSQTSAACLKLVATCVIFAFVCVCFSKSMWTCICGTMIMYSMTFLFEKCLFLMQYICRYSIYIYIYIYIYMLILPNTVNAFPGKSLFVGVCVCVCVCVCLCTLWFMYCHCGTACYSQTFWPSCLLWHVQCCN